MSVPLSDERFGFDFSEVVVTIEALDNAVFEDAEKAVIAQNTRSYLWEKVWTVYPYDSEDYYLRNPGDGDGAVRPK